jgi:hypothetical protein
MCESCAVRWRWSGRELKERSLRQEQQASAAAGTGTAGRTYCNKPETLSFIHAPRCQLCCCWCDPGIRTHDISAVPRYGGRRRQPRNHDLGGPASLGLPPLSLLLLLLLIIRRPPLVAPSWLGKSAQMHCLTIHRAPPWLTQQPKSPSPPPPKLLPCAWEDH